MWCPFYNYPINNINNNKKKKYLDFLPIFVWKYLTIMPMVLTFMKLDTKIKISDQLIKQF